MADEVEVRYVEHPDADLSPLIQAVQSMQHQVYGLSDEVVSVSSQVENIESSFEAFLNEFKEFIEKDLKDRRLQEALSDRVSLQQEIEKRFSRHQMVRRYVTGILQAADTSLVKLETISESTEELMIAIPHYWLVPALIALSAWLNNDRQLAERAIREAINRDDEKTSLLFSLICRRASRNAAANEWLYRYFSMQDPMNVERKLIVVLDAYANGLFGGDSRGLCAKQLGNWIVEMEDVVGFREEQVARWEKAIVGKCPNETYKAEYPYLSKYARNWEEIRSTLNNSQLHLQMLEYMRNVFEQPNVDNISLNQELDELLNSLISNYDEDELPIRERKHFADLIVECQGDEAEATRRFDSERPSFTSRSDLTQLLTNAAMNPELLNASPATQKLSMSVSRDWMIEAYNNVTLRNRNNAVNEIHFAIKEFQSKTIEGLDEEEICNSVEVYFGSIRDERIAAVKQDPIDFFFLIAGIVLLYLGLTNVFPWYLGLIGCGIGIAKFVSGKNKVRSNISDLILTYAKIINDAQVIVRALCAEVIDMRREVKKNEENYQPLVDYMQQISPEQFVKNNGQRNVNIA